MKTTTLPLFFILTTMYSLGNPAALLAECQGSIVGSSALVCEFTGQKKGITYREIGDEEKEKVKRSKAVRLLKQDRRRLKIAKTQLKQLLKQLNRTTSRSLNNNVTAYTTTSEALINAESTLANFDNETGLLNGLDMQNLSQEEIRIISQELLRQVQKTSQENKRQLLYFNIPPGPGRKSKKMKNHCNTQKKRQKLNNYICLTETFCKNGKDDDGDGLIDCNDSDCRGKNGCPSCVEGEFPASLIYKTDYTESCSCFNSGFVQWDNTLSENSTSVTSVIDWTGGNPREFTRTMSAPYDNTYSIAQGEIIHTSPSGSSWIYATGNSSADLNPIRCAPDCSTILANLQMYIANPRVRIACQQ